MISDTDKLACAERELRMRKKVYPRWVEKGMITDSTAKLEVLLMEAIVEDYRAKVDGQKLL